jgi:hypothetical protein
MIIRGSALLWEFGYRGSMPWCIYLSVESCQDLAQNELSPLARVKEAVGAKRSPLYRSTRQTLHLCVLETRKRKIF